MKLIPVIRRLAVSVLVVAAAAVAVPPAAGAGTTAPVRHRTPKAAAVKAPKAAAVRTPKAAVRPRRALFKPDPGYRQVNSRGRSYGRMFRSGTGRNIQNLNGVNTPSFLIGPQQTTVTSAGSITSQGVYCGPGDRSCNVHLSMRGDRPRP